MYKYANYSLSGYTKIKASSFHKIHTDGVVMSKIEFKRESSTKGMIKITCKGISGYNYPGYHITLTFNKVASDGTVTKLWDLDVTKLTNDGATITSGWVKLSGDPNGKKTYTIRVACSLGTGCTDGANAAEYKIKKTWTSTADVSNLNFDINYSGTTVYALGTYDLATDATAEVTIKLYEGTYTSNTPPTIVSEIASSYDEFVYEEEYGTLFINLKNNKAYTIYIHVYNGDESSPINLYSHINFTTYGVSISSISSNTRSIQFDASGNSTTRALYCQVYQYKDQQGYVNIQNFDIGGISTSGKQIDNLTHNSNYKILVTMNNTYKLDWDGNDTNELDAYDEKYIYTENLYILFSSISFEIISNSNLYLAKTYWTLSHNLTKSCSITKVNNIETISFIGETYRFDAKNLKSDTDYTITITLSDGVNTVSLSKSIKTPTPHVKICESVNADGTGNWGNYIPYICTYADKNGNNAIWKPLNTFINIDNKGTYRELKP